MPNLPVFLHLVNFSRGYRTITFVKRCTLNPCNQVIYQRGRRVALSLPPPAFPFKLPKARGKRRNIWIKNDLGRLGNLIFQRTPFLMKALLGPAGGTRKLFSRFFTRACPSIYGSIICVQTDRLSHTPLGFALAQGCRFPGTEKNILDAHQLRLAIFTPHIQIPIYGITASDVGIMPERKLLANRTKNIQV
jgi:hypothetical protein